MENLFGPHTPAPFVVLLASEEAPVTGQFILTGGRFVARMSLGIGAGVAGIDTPEQVLGEFGAIGDLVTPTFPQSIPTPWPSMSHAIMDAVYKSTELDLFG